MHDDVQLKWFKITCFGDDTYEQAPSKASIIEDLSRAGAYDKDVIIEEIDPTIPQEQSKPTDSTNSNTRRITPKIESKIFTLPGGQKVKEVNGVLFGLEWKDFTKKDLISKIGCEDIELPDDVLTVRILDWVELKPEEEE